MDKILRLTLKKEKKIKATKKWIFIMFKFKIRTKPSDGL